jgi:hypothetical protein
MARFNPKDLDPQEPPVVMACHMLGAIELLDCRPNAEEAEKWVERVTESQWWGATLGRGDVRVKVDGRRRYPEAFPPDAIALPRTFVRLIDLLHELSHCGQPSGTAPHSPEFARLFIDLGTLSVSVEQGRLIDAALRAEGVEIGRRWYRLPRHGLV